MFGGLASRAQGPGVGSQALASGFEFPADSGPIHRGAYGETAPQALLLAAPCAAPAGLPGGCGTAVDSVRLWGRRRQDSRRPLNRLCGPLWSNDVVGQGERNLSKGLSPVGLHSE